jgi:single-strand DNA-binding protein
MEQITGRLVRNAEIKKTKDGRELVAFTVAVNDRYKPKGKDEVKETRFFGCAYWMGTKVKDALKQGTIVTLFGRINLNAYKGSDGEYHASLTFHASHIEIIASVKKGGSPQVEATSRGVGTPEVKDDLPF